VRYFLFVPCVSTKTKWLIVFNNFYEKPWEHSGSRSMQFVDSFMAASKWRIAYNFFYLIYGRIDNVKSISILYETKQVHAPFDIQNSSSPFISMQCNVFDFHLQKIRYVLSRKVFIFCLHCVWREMKEKRMKWFIADGRKNQNSNKFLWHDSE
jgi:hypothetical protein